MVRTLLAAMAGCLVLVGCSNGGGGARADDPVPTTSSAPTRTPAGTPTGTQNAGRYPAYAPQDYSYTLTVTCFCADAGAPIRVTVQRGEAVDAIYLGDGRGVSKGDEPDQRRWLTIDDVIDLANDTDADHVDVTWPRGQDHPSSVSVTQGERLADASTSYAVAEVELMKQTTGQRSR